MKRVIPEKVTLNSNQMLEALSLYLDHIFDAPHGTYRVKNCDVFVDKHECTLDRSPRKESLSQDFGMS